MNKKPPRPPVFPPETTTIGILGSGQLGRMFAFAAHRMGYRVHVFSPACDSPAGRVADWETVASYEDQTALREFAKQIDVATLEFENIPSASLQRLEQFVPVRPGPSVLETAQHRVREKTALATAGFPVADFRVVHSQSELENCFTGSDSTHVFPAILKTAAWGYDGKGQSRIESPSDIETAWKTLNCDHAVLEAFVDFEHELSVVAARSANGEIACYDPIRNMHCNHILDVSVSPSGLPKDIVKQAKELASAILESLDVIGVMCIELFLTRDNRLVINELAPRPHNSGHLTMEAHATSQFDQQVRAVCGLPLGSTEQLRPAAMVNLLGDLWQTGQPDFASATALPSTYVHLYGKIQPKVGRKMGHITALGDTETEATNKAMHARQLLTAHANTQVDTKGAHGNLSGCP